MSKPQDTHIEQLPHISLPQTTNTIAEFRFMKWLNSIDISPVPEEFRQDFIQAMFTETFVRFLSAMKFGAYVTAVSILIFDVFNIAHVDMTQHYILYGVFPKVLLFLSTFAGYTWGSRLKLACKSMTLTRLISYTSLFRICITLSAYSMLLGMMKINPQTEGIGAYAVFVFIITSGLYVDYKYAISVAVFNFLILAGVLWMLDVSWGNMLEKLVVGGLVLATAVYSTQILFVGFRKEFAHLKSVEQAKNKAEELTVSLIQANEEVERQLEVLAEQARDIEITNTALQEKTIELEFERNELEKMNIELDSERNKSDTLLLNILPKAIAQRLKSGESRIADKLDNVSVLFADLVGFTEFSEKISAEKLVEILDSIFSEFDRIAEKYQLEKIKTIGDAYMLVGGICDGQTHTQNIAHAASEMLELFHREDQKLHIRIGIHSGCAVAGVIGSKKFAYDLWGDAVNVAARMESHGIPDTIQVSEDFRLSLLAEYPSQSTELCHFEFVERGEIDIKGKGTMRTYFIKRKEAC